MTNGEPTIGVKVPMLFLNDTPIEGATVTPATVGKGPKSYELSIAGEPAWSLVKSLSSARLLEVFRTVEWNGRDPEMPMLVSWGLIRPNRFYVRLAASLEEWDQPYSFSLYERSLLKALKQEVPSWSRPSRLLTVHLNLRPDTGFSVSAPFSERCVADLCLELVGVVRRVERSVRLQCLATVRKHALTVAFEFPPAVAVACEQYLLYFAQFLRDLGEDATVDLLHHAEATILSVVPNAGTEVSAVRQSLDTFLSLPGIPTFMSEAARSRDPAVTQLAANVAFLQSQLLLARATIQIQDATILALHTPARDITQPEGSALATEKESLIPGVVDVVPVRRAGFQLNLPELLRRLKRAVPW